MSFLTSWIFWIIIAAIVLLLAIIGYLSESRKKSVGEPSALDNSTLSTDKDEVKSNAGSGATIESANVISNGGNSLDDWSVMPEINSSFVSSNGDFNSNSKNDFSVTESAVPAAPEVQTPVIEPVVPAVPAEQTPVMEPVVPAAPEVQAPVIEPVVPAEPEVQTPVIEPVVPAEPEVQTPVIEPVVPAAPIEQSQVIEPNDIFNPGVNSVSVSPVPVPAESSPVITPTPLPSNLDLNNNPQPQLNKQNDIETL